MFRRMRGRFSLLICFLCLLSILCMQACVPSEEILRMKEQGYFPTADDFPLTKWVCREADLYFYMLDDGAKYMIGEYNVGGTVYRTVVGARLSHISFACCAPGDTSISVSDHTDENGQAFAHTRLISQQSIYAEYIYQNGVITCTIDNAIFSFQPGDVLTFDNAGAIATKPEARWRCLELDMYLDSFYDAEHYFKGEIVLNGKRHTVQAYDERGCYEFIFNTHGVTSVSEAYTFPLINGVFAFEEDRIICTLTDDHLLYPMDYSYWDYPGAVLTFVKEPIPET